MPIKAGVWIDHKQAIIVILKKRSAQLKKVVSNVEKRTHYSGASHAKPSIGARDEWAEDKRDRRYDDHLHHYYDEVLNAMGEVDQLVIIGPGEAKTELANRIEAQGTAVQVAGIEPADKLTDAQIAARVRDFFDK